jgi:hypothetical protein
MKILTEFKNRKVVHQELFEERIIIVTASKANGFESEKYSTFICNKRLDILSDDTHSAETESVEALVELTKKTISQFV